MKILLTLTAVTLTALAAVPTEVSAWYCRATSTNGAWGWGTSSNVYDARVRALYECAVRTPRNHTCYIRYCN
jgi:hypothetical protein